MMTIRDSTEPAAKCPVPALPCMNHYNCYGLVSNNQCRILLMPVSVGRDVFGVDIDEVE